MNDRSVSLRGHCLNAEGLPPLHSPTLTLSLLLLLVHPRPPSQGLAAMKSMGAELGLPVEVYGPESSMTGICTQAIQYVQSCGK
jgi:hypothetical protein